MARQAFLAVLLLALACAGRVAAPGQDTRAPKARLPVSLRPVELTNTTTIPVEGVESPRALLLPIKCGLDGNIYVRMYQHPVQESPIWKISLDGKRASRLLPRDPLSPAGALNVIDFSVTSTGRVIVLNSKRKDEKEEPHAFVTTFDSEGNLLSEDQVNQEFVPQQIAALGSEYLVIAGQEQSSDSTFGSGKAYIGIFDSHLTLLRRISSNKDTKAKSDLKDSQSFEFSLQSSVLETGNDGRVYLMRKGSSGPILVISAAGQLERVIQVHAPEESSLTGIKAAEGRLLAHFVVRAQAPSQGKARGIDKQFFVIYDPSTGKAVAEYTISDRSLGGAFACYSPDALVFLKPGKSSQHLEFLNVAIR